jgi:hypothetical protein
MLASLGNWGTGELAGEKTLRIVARIFGTWVEKRNWECANERPGRYKDFIKRTILDSRERAQTFQSEVTGPEVQ